MNQTKIEWVKNPDGSQGFTWNPIKGRCPVNCWYCYMKRMYDRFPWLLEGNGNGVLDLEEVEAPRKRKKPTTIFLCSTYDLFNPYKNDPKSMNMIFDSIKACPQHTFQILTKFPENIDRPMPDNVWLGVTVESGKEIDRTYRLAECQAKIKFVSFEPLLGQFYKDDILHIQIFDWIIIGRLTGFGKEYAPANYSIEEIMEAAEDTPIFLKDNLNWPEKIQEFPKAGARE